MLSLTIPVPAEDLMPAVWVGVLTIGRLIVFPIMFVGEPLDAIIPEPSP